MNIPFFTKRVENVDESLLERIKKLESKYNTLSAEMLDTTLSVNIMRDKVLRKIQFKREQEEEEETPKKAKDLYNGVLIPEK